MQDMLIVEGDGVTMTGSRILRPALDVSILTCTCSNAAPTQAAQVPKPLPKLDDARG